MEKKPIKILHVIDSLRIGGAEMLLTQIIKALGDINYEHYIYYFDSDGPLREYLTPLNVVIYKGVERESIRKPLKFLKTLFALFSDLISFIKQYDIQILQSHLPPANQLAAIAGFFTKIPTFPTIHTPLVLSKSGHFFNLIFFIKQLANFLVFRTATSLIVVSQEIKEIYQKAFSINEHRIFVLKNGIVLPKSDVNLSLPSLNTKNISTRFIFIAVGRLVPLKNFDVLIRAAKNLCAKGITNFMVHIAGDGPEKYRLETLIDKLQLGDRVKLLGLRNDVMNIMRFSDAFVIPSQYEGLSIAMIEAMASGLPIIASDIRGLKDYIKNNQNGLIFKQGDPAKLAECMYSLIINADLRSYLSKSSRESFENCYNLRKNIKPLDALFRSAIL